MTVSIQVEADCNSIFSWSHQKPAQPCFLVRAEAWRMQNPSDRVIRKIKYLKQHKGDKKVSDKEVLTAGRLRSWEKNKKRIHFFRTVILTASPTNVKGRWPTERGGVVSSFIFRLQVTHRRLHSSLGSQITNTYC